MVEKVRRAAESLFTDVCSIYEKRPVVQNGRTEFEKVCVKKNMPCRVSAKSYLFGENSAEDGDNTAKVSKTVKLFIPADCIIEPGSIIEVTKLGVTEIYIRSGALTRYSSHCEVMIRREKDWA